MSIRRMIPMGTVLRKCIVCGYQITAKDHELTAHEIECLEIKVAGGDNRKEK